MPNTVAHLGVQGVATRSVLQEADYKWIYLGCIIPDLPWILWRTVKFLIPWVNLYDLRLYAIVQSSLLFSLFLSISLAMFTSRPQRVFSILGLNSLFHLFLDACQTKWANGVLLLAPFSWKLSNFGLFWPESMPTYLLTGFGFIFILAFWKKSLAPPLDMKLPSLQSFAIFIILFTGYFALPFPLMPEAQKANNHYVETLRLKEQRNGKYVELDRVSYLPDSGKGVVRTFAKETIPVKGISLSHPATVSVRGIFNSADRITVLEYHVHEDWFRDNASYVGLLLVIILWVAILFRKRRKLPS